MLHRLPGNPTREQLEEAYAQGMLRKESLRDGGYYAGRCRNASVARWHAGSQQFVHWRTKFSERFLESIRHPEDESVYDVFMPTAELTGVDLPEGSMAITDAQMARHLSFHERAAS